MKIGVVIADEKEYAPFAAMIDDGTPFTFFQRKGITFSLQSGNRRAQVYCVLCKIGKVNAAAATAHLIDIGCGMILNFGLSGGISGVRRGDLVLADRYLEHDFDLTMIGYKPCEKPDQRYIYDADSRLLSLFSAALPGVCSGTAVCGDRFICNADERGFLSQTFHAVSCDMETGAIAAVCDMAGVPFLALRRISDDAGADAEDSYREMNDSGETTLSDAFYRCLLSVIGSDFLEINRPNA